jgi:hypothetical protein
MSKIIESVAVLGCYALYVGSLLDILRAVGCPKMSVTHYQPVLHNIPEEQLLLCCKFVLLEAVWF